MNQKSATGIVEQFRLDGKVSLVTGASRGIGLAMAEGLAGAGSDIVVVGREIETLTPVAEQIAGETGRNVLPIQADVSNLTEIDALVAQTVETFGRLDVLVNNAGVNIRNPALEFTEADWDFVTDVNLKGAFFLAKACGTVMQQQKSGKVIKHVVAYLSDRIADECRLYGGKRRTPPIDKTSRCGMGGTQTFRSTASHPDSSEPR